MVKISKPHTTLVDTAKIITAKLKNHPDVTKISAGVIQSIGSGPIGVKITSESGAILLQVRCSSAVQDVRVYSPTHDTVIEFIREFVTSKGWLLR